MGNVNINGKLQFLSTKYCHIEFCGISWQGKKILKVKKDLINSHNHGCRLPAHQYKFHFENGVFQKEHN